MVNGFEDWAMGATHNLYPLSTVMIESELMHYYFLMQLCACFLVDDILTFVMEFFYCCYRGKSAYRWHFQYHLPTSSCQRLINFLKRYSIGRFFFEKIFYFQTHRLGWLRTSLTVPLSHSLSPRTVWLSTEDCRPGRSSMKIVMPRLRLLVLYLATMASSLSEASFGK